MAGSLANVECRRGPSLSTDALPGSFWGKVDFASAVTCSDSVSVSICLVVSSGSLEAMTVLSDLPAKGVSIPNVSTAMGVVRSFDGLTTTSTFA